MRAVICPVCNGSGKYQTPKEAMDGSEGKTCHGCSGRGWIEINETAPAVIAYPVYPTYPGGTSPWGTWITWGPSYVHTSGNGSGGDSAFTSGTSYAGGNGSGSSGGLNSGDVYRAYEYEKKRRGE